jgi:hypothetical protein
VQVEAGIDFDLHEVGKIFARTPYIGNLKPGGEYVMKDLYDTGGVPVLMKALLDGGYLHGDCITVTGKTIATNLKNIFFPEKQNVIRPTSNPFSPTARRGRAQGQPGAARSDRKGRRHAAAAIHRPRALLRLRGGCVRRGTEPRLRDRRRNRHPL